MDEKWLKTTLDAADKEISKRLKLSGENRVKYKLLSAAFVDENELYLLVTPTGARCWVQRLTIRGRRRELGLSGFPLVSLAEAREKAFDNRRLARSGGDPLAEKRITK